MMHRTVQIEPDGSDPGSDIDLTSASLEHLQRLQSVTDAALAKLSIDELLDELLIRVR